MATATVGFDTRRDRWLAGVALSYSEGEGAYTHPDGLGGAVASTLASLSPFARYRFGERASVWGALGYGRGDLTLSPDAIEAVYGTDIANRMAAFGGRARIGARAGQIASFQLEAVSDVRLTNTSSNTASNLAGVDAATGRARLLLKGSGTLAIAGVVLLPTLEAGLRYDTGDAETGAGVEVGAGLGYAAGRLSVQVNVRGLLAHEDAEYEEWGLSGRLAYTPRPDGRGLTMSLGSTLGAVHSGVQALWNRQTAAGLARGGAEMPAGQSFQGELGYIVDGLRGRALWTPYLGAEAAGHGARALQFGLKVVSGPNLEAHLGIGQRTGGAGEPERTLELGGSVRF